MAKDPAFLFYPGDYKIIKRKHCNMKKFSDLTIDDKVYMCRINCIDMWEHSVKEIRRYSSVSDIYTSGKTRSISNWEDSFIEDRDMYIFCNKSEAVRYSKLQGIKHLRKLILEAKNTIDKVIEFRKENFENLNKNWLESDIKELEFFRKNNK